MKKLIIGAVVGLLVASLLLSGGIAAAEGGSTGTFPDRTISVTRSPPGGPAKDAFSITMAPSSNGYWSVVTGSVAGAAVVVEVFRNDAGILKLESSSKLKVAGQQSQLTLLSPGLSYQAVFKPYGKAGTSVFYERFYVPPVASFTYSPAAPTTDDIITFDASASTDQNNDIAGYVWDFGDGSTASGVLVTHQYASVLTYTASVTVFDSTPGGSIGPGPLATTQAQVIAVAPSRNQKPMAAFTVTRDLMSVSVDGTASSDPDGTIVAYAWDFGDSTTATGVSAAHTYAAPGKYAVTLRVSDDAGGVGTAVREVSVNTMTEDWTFYDFFNVPYGEWWDIRNYYATQAGSPEPPIGADCFSADGMANGPPWCAPSSPLPDVASFPYTSWVTTPVGDAMVVAPYRFTADIRQNPAFTADQPVMLPRCEDLLAAAAGVGVDYACIASPPTGGSISVNEHISYLTSARAIALAVRGCPDLTYLNDGFVTELEVTITMDSAAAAKLFGVTDPSQWAFGTADTALLKAGCGTGLLLDPSSGVLEKGLKAWFEAQGNGPYDILSAFGDSFQVFAIEASGSFDAATNRHTLTADIVAQGHEALFARWAYWGATTYLAGLGGAPAMGWWGMEQPWTEDLRFVATFGATSFDAQVSGAIQYHLRASGDVGGDGIWYTSDDVPKWVWQPILGDRYPGSPLHPASELTAYAGLGYIHTTPGSRRYGSLYFYDYVPAIWQLKTGEMQTFRFPTTPVVLYDPYLSARIDNPQGLVAISAGIVLGSSVPATGVGIYDAATNTLMVAGPTSVGTYPTSATGKPLESRPMYNLVRA